MGQERLDLRPSHLPRVALAVEVDEAARPVQVRCYYYERLSNLKIVVTDTSLVPEACTTTSLAAISSPKAGPVNVATPRSSASDVAPSPSSPQVFEKRSGPKPSGQGKG